MLAEKINFLYSYGKTFEDIFLNIGMSLKNSNINTDILKKTNFINDNKLFSAIEYSYSNGGKRLRPILALLSAEAVLGLSHDDITESLLRKNPAMGLAIAIELIHCGSLVHDDLPCMDNDDLRRGKPTNHRVFGEDMALLTGDFLLVNPISTFINYSKNILNIEDSLILEVSSNLLLAIEQMIIGQAMDLELAKENFHLKAGTESQTVETQYLEKSKIMQEYKTGALLSASIINAALLAKAKSSQINALKQYASNLGLAFQIADDVLDYTATTEQMGKQTQKDKEQNKLTYVDIYGIDEAKLKAEKLITEAKEILSAVDIYSDKLKLIADYVICRNN